MYNAIGADFLHGDHLSLHLILSHENADFDAIASMLAAHKLNPEATPVLSERVNRNVGQFLTLYASALPFVARQDYKPTHVEAITLVDTQRTPQLKGIKPKTPTLIIDHHPLADELGSHQRFWGDTLGATTTLLVEAIERQAIPLSSLEATLLALGIYEDTGSLTYGKTTARDIRAAAWLLERGASLDTVRRFLEPPLNDEQQALLETLLRSADSRTLHGLTIVVCTATVNEAIAEISAVASRLRDILDADALFILVSMPGILQLVFRSNNDAIDVGAIAKTLGGGGHERAAAAALHNVEQNEVIPRIWEEAQRAIEMDSRVTRVADLMSFGVQTVDAGAQINKIIRQLRRIGHEGFPVLEEGRVVGLLTRRDADRAIEHGLGHLSVRDVMASGTVTLRPEDTVSTLEARMVESGWGQIPVLDDAGRLIGIVTRTDLIKHWAHSHPEVKAPPGLTVTIAQIEDTLGEATARLIQAIGEHASEAGTAIYMVGGCVRDLLLSRHNLDIDFVVEGDAIAFAQGLQARFGGHIASFRPFGTAKWTLDASALLTALNLEADGLPTHIDFATARNEFYEHPTALPTVYHGSIKLDLQRRDFTINTLAVQLSPRPLFGRVLDFYGGLNDLRSGLIRVLHSLSFVDDPTRILRATRFEHRLGFTIEPRTAELIQTALPMLARITGERIRSEFTLLLHESEPEAALYRLQERDILRAIHPAFVIDEQLGAQFAAARRTIPFASAMSTVDLYWHLIGLQIERSNLANFCERMMMPRELAQSMQKAALLVEQIGTLADPNARVSQLAARLADASDTALCAVWIKEEDTILRERIQQYMTQWRYVRPRTDGRVLHELGVPKGPCYGRLIHRMQAARLDGEVRTDEEELALLRRLIKDGYCDDRT